MVQDGEKKQFGFQNPDLVALLLHIPNPTPDLNLKLRRKIF